MKLISFSIITPSASASYQVEWIEIEGQSGTFFVGLDHAPLISIVKHRGLIAFKEAGLPATELICPQGTFCINANQATLISDDLPSSPQEQKS
jgi:F0F1-type ATP synthase epsilon subunit